MSDPAGSITNVTDRVGNPLSYTPADLKIPDGITKANISLTERLGNLFGKKVEAVQNLADRAGNALGVATDPATGKVLVSNGQEGLAARSKLIAGGMTESLGKSGQYDAFRDAVIKSIPEDELAASVNKYKNIYGNNPALIEREVVNEWVSNNLYNSPAIKQIVSADPQLATGVRNYFNELGSKLNGVDELKAVKQEVAQAEGIWERVGRKNISEVDFKPNQYQNPDMINQVDGYGTPRNGELEVDNNRILVFENSRGEILPILKDVQKTKPKWSPSIYKEWIGVNQRNNLLSSINNNKLKNAVNELFREGAIIGNGRTADEIRFEQTTGIPLSKKGHIQKGRDVLSYLERTRSEYSLSPEEINIVNMLIDDLVKALGVK